jgi:hypothetical protein
MPLYKNKPAGVKFAYSLNQIEVDCRQQQYRYVLSAYYTKGGEVVGTENTINTFVPAIPDSVGANMVRVVCAAME